MKVSILLPVYNAESTIQEALDSILKQTFHDYEVIIINDGSTDRSEETILRYKDKRFQYFRNDGNKGLIYTLNRGLELCKGEYIARMDADDIMLPERLDRQVHFMDAHPDIIASGSSVIKFYSNGKQKLYTPPLKPEVIQYKILLGSPIPHPAAIIRGDVLRRFNVKYDEHFIHAEDYKFWYDLSRIGILANMKCPLLKYRCFSEQVSQKHQVEQNRISCSIRRKIVEDNLRKQGVLFPIDWDICSIRTLSKQLVDNPLNSTILFLFVMSQEKLGIKSFFSFLSSRMYFRKGFELKYLVAILWKYLNHSALPKLTLYYR